MIAAVICSHPTQMGRDAVWYGSMHDGINDARLSAPTRISYTQIPDLIKDY